MQSPLLLVLISLAVSVGLGILAGMVVHSENGESSPRGRNPFGGVESAHNLRAAEKCALTRLHRPG
jgi:hypothetical protein